MHAAKRLAWQKFHRQSQRNHELKLSYAQQLDLAKLELRKQFETLAEADKLFCSLFKLRRDSQPLGVGSFGMVLLAEAVDDVTAGCLARAQAAAAAAATPSLPSSISWPSWRLEPPASAALDDADEIAPPASGSASRRLALTRGQPVAVKFEFNIDRRKRKYQLAGEFRLLTELFNCYGAGLEGFPEPFLFGSLQTGDSFTDGGAAYRCHHYLAMELLGENLRARFQDLPPPPRSGHSDGSPATFPLSFVFDVARQLLTRLMLLHAEPICGVNSPLTDLESAAYIVARFLRNSFPWDGMQGSDSDSRRRGMARLKTRLWSFVEHVRRGRCLQPRQGSPDWPRLFFADRTDAQGRGGPQLLKYMSRLIEYTRSQLTAAESIDYNYLFNCFVLPHGAED
uniref:Protein kinase domain-containing protein n=1 Tax=Macrostomum lignano TaxID=282301 RepID=A0A1I8IP77_9PLAT